MEAAPTPAAPDSPKKRRSRAWWPFACAVLGALVGFGALQFAPPRYRAFVSVMIVPQRVPESMVKSLVTSPIAERLDAIAQQVLSRTRLEGVIQEFDLYRRERETWVMEDLIAQMRKDITVSISADPREPSRAALFTLGFESPDAQTAMRVTERLGSLFVQENAEDRQSAADQANQFLRDQLADIRRRLIGSESALAEFSARTGGRRAPAYELADSDVLQETARALLRHAEETKLSISMERRQLGEKLMIIDGARLPERPISPEPGAFVLRGALGGFFFGLLLIPVSSTFRTRRARRALPRAGAAS